MKGVRWRPSFPLDYFISLSRYTKSLSSSLCPAFCTFRNTMSFCKMLFVAFSRTPTCCYCHQRRNSPFLDKNTIKCLPLSDDGDGPPSNRTGSISMIQTSLYVGWDGARFTLYRSRRRRCWERNVGGGREWLEGWMEVNRNNVDAVPIDERGNPELDVRDR